METNHKASKINLFWTGDWDLTFRLLEILLNKMKFVQSYYIIDPNRPSHEIEMNRMDKTRKLIYRKYQSTRAQLLPTINIQLSDVQDDAVIEKAFKEANEKQHLGNQYDWLARFCKQFHIDNMDYVFKKWKAPPIFPGFHLFLKGMKKVGNLSIKSPYQMSQNIFFSSALNFQFST